MGGFFIFDCHEVTFALIKLSSNNSILFDFWHQHAFISSSGMDMF